MPTKSLRAELARPFCFVAQVLLPALSAKPKGVFFLCLKSVNSVFFFLYVLCEKPRLILRFTGILRRLG